MELTKLNDAALIDCIQRIIMGHSMLHGDEPIMKISVKLVEELVGRFESLCDNKNVLS